MTDTITHADRQWLAHVVTHLAQHTDYPFAFDVGRVATTGNINDLAAHHFEHQGTGAWKRGLAPAALTASARYPHAPSAQPWLDMLTRRYSAFGSFDALVNAQGDYRPSIYPGAWKDMLAWAYDNYQAKRGDPRRAFPDYPGRLQGWTRATHTIRTPGPWSRTTTEEV